MPGSQIVAPSSSPTDIKIGEAILHIPPEAKSLLLTRGATGWSTKEVATMGASDVFVRRDASGSLKLVEASVSLSEAKKEVVKMKGGYSITIAGYNRLNQIAGIYILTPDEIMLGGNPCSNPHVEYRGEKMVRVVARKIAIGYSPIGNLVAVDVVRHYNFEAYFLQDLNAKTAIPALARYGTRLSCPFDPTMKVEQDGESYYAKRQEKIFIFKPVKDIEGIWMDMSHPDISEIYSQHIQHQKFGEVIAQNLASRNALKAHPAIASQSVIVNNGFAVVKVYGYRHDLTREKIQAMGEKIVKGEELSGVEVARDEGEAPYEEVSTATVTEGDDDRPEGGGDGSTAPAEPQRPREELVKEIEAMGKEKGLDIEKKSRDIFDARFTNLTDEQVARMHSLISSLRTQPKKGE